MLKNCPLTRTQRTKRSRFSPVNMVLRPIKKNAKVQAAIVGALTWTLAWKSVSLWRAAKNDSKPWFITLIVTNTMGILDAFYIFVIDRRGHDKQRDINALYAAADADIAAEDPDDL